MRLLIDPIGRDAHGTRIEKEKPMRFDLRTLFLVLEFGYKSCEKGKSYLQTVNEFKESFSFALWNVKRKKKGKG